MSRKLRNGLLIGGGALLALVIGLLILFISFTTLTGSGSVANQAPMDFDMAERGVGGGADDVFYDEAMEEEMPAAEPAALAPTYDGNAVAGEAVYPQAVDDIAAVDVQVDRLIIRNGSVTVSVEDTLAAKEAIEQYVERFAQEGAFIVNSDQYGGGQGSPYVSMQIRVPASQFDATMDAIACAAAASSAAQCA